MKSTHPHGRSGPELAGFSGRALRALCLALSAVAVGVFVLGLPLYYRQLQVPCAAVACYVSPTPAQLQALQAGGISPSAYAAYQVGVVALHALVNFLVAAIIFLRRPTDPMAWFTGLTLVTFAAIGVQDSLAIQELLGSVPPVWRWLLAALTMVGSSSLPLFFFIFPNGVFVPRRLLWPVLALLAWQLLTIAFPGAWFDTITWPFGLRLIYWVVFFAALLGAQVYRYRNVSSALERQQSKWAVLGFGLALGGALAAYLLTEAALGSESLRAVATLVRPTSYFWFLPILPLFIGLAILRSRLWDIDLLIRRTLVYSVLTGLLALVYFGSVVVIQGVVRGLTGSESPLVVVLSTLLIAALFMPLRGRVQQAIDRRFYRRKYDAARTLATFGTESRNETDLGRLSARLMGVVHETMQPAQAALWLMPVAGEHGRRPHSAEQP